MHKKVGNGSAAAADGYGGRVGGVGGKGDVGSAAAGNSLSYRIDVFGVGAGKQGRKGERLAAGIVGVIKVAVAGKSPSVSILVGGSGGSEFPWHASTRVEAVAAKNPEGLVGVILAGIDVDDQLRLALLWRG